MPEEQNQPDSKLSAIASFLQAMKSAGQATQSAWQTIKSFFSRLISGNKQAAQDKQETEEIPPPTLQTRSDVTTSVSPNDLNQGIQFQPNSSLANTPVANAPDINTPITKTSPTPVADPLDMVEILTQQISDRENENKLSRLQDRIKLDKLEQQITEALILNPGIDLYQDPNLSSVVRERNELVSKQHKLVPDEQIDNMRAILDERARLDSEIKSANALISQLEESLRVAQSNEISVGAIWDLRNTIRNLETRLERENLSTSERDLIQQDIEKLKSQYTNLLKESNENQSFIFNAQLDSANAKQNLLESSQRAAELEKQYQNTFNPQEYLEAANKRAAVASQLKTSQQEYTGVSSALRDAQSRRAQQGTVSTPARESAPKIPLKPLDQNAVSEIRDLYPKNILRAVGVNNIATLPVVNIKRTLYEDDSDSLYPSTKPLTAHEMAPYKAVRGVDSEGRPFISYINEQSVACTLFPLNKNDMNWSSVQSIRVPNARQDIEPLLNGC